MDNFVAIDFETANFAQSSVCSVGLVIVKDGEIVDNYFSLIRPIPNYYDARCSEVNGLHLDDTNGAPEFPDVWMDAQRKIHEYFPYIEDGEVPFVAHNKAFDESCLKAVFRCYQMDYPEYEFHCTCQSARRAFPNAENHQLHTISMLCGYRLENHHHALADAEACAWIAREIL